MSQDEPADSVSDQVGLPEQKNIEDMSQEPAKVADDVAKGCFGALMPIFLILSGSLILVLIIFRFR